MVFYIEFGEDKVPFIQLGDYQLRVNLEDLDKQFKQRAKDELRETPEIVDDALEILREHIRGEPGLHLPVEDTQFLLKFLRPKKFDPDKAFKVMRNFYKFKFTYPKYGLNATPNSTKLVFENEVLMFLPSRTPSGCRIMVVNAGSNWNPKLIEIGDIVRGVMVAMEVAMIEPTTQVAGVQVIVNMEGLSLKHLTQFTPIVAKRIIHAVQDCLPLRLRGIHVINQSYIFDVLYTIFKPFIGEKLRKRLFFHGPNRKSLCDKLSAEALPESLGGLIPDYPGKLLLDLLSLYEEKFKEVATYHYSEETN